VDGTCTVEEKGDKKVKYLTNIHRQQHEGKQKFVLTNPNHFESNAYLNALHLTLVYELKEEKNKMNQQQDNQDLYSILNLPRNATQSQIKTAYRKLALKYHPDRQSSPEEKEKCTEIFTKIGNAYEVLADPNRRKNYDRYGIIDDHASPSHNDASAAGGDFHDPFRGGFFGGRDPFQDPFFTGGTRENGRFGGFMDPFEIFQSFFGDEFSHEFHNEDYLPGSRNRRQRTNSNRNPYGNDMSGFGFGGGGFGPLGSGFGNFMGFGHHIDAMNSMMNQLHQQHSQQQGFSSSSYSSSTSYGGGNSGGRGGVQESVTTSTRIINGKRQTITERVRVNPDGTVERHTETSGDDDFPSMQHLGYNGHNSRNAIENHNSNRFLPESHRHDETSQEKTQENLEKAEEDTKHHKKRRFFWRNNDEP
jgi:curved DNA-binding protein CbpA